MKAAGINVGVEGRDFTLKVRPASLVQVLDNLVHNALYWVGTLAENNPRRVGVVIDADEGKILVADSGPGVGEETAAHVFDSFFSMRADGKGLGLHISTELIRNLKGRLRLAGPEDSHLIPGWATGAVFVAEFDTSVRVKDMQQEGENHGA